MAAAPGKVKLALALLTVLASGCMAARGRMPDTGALESGALEPGVSTKADVFEALGPPAGFGMTRVSYAAEARVIWSYEAVRPGYKTAEVGLLLVFFKGQTYDGYLWFSSNDKVEMHWQ